MDRNQAEAIAQAILQPDLHAQEEIRLKRERETAYLARKRRVAVYTLVGSGIGAVVAHYLGHRFTYGVVWGGFAASILGWAATRRSS